MNKLTLEQVNELIGFAAMFANIENVDESGNPNTLSVREIHQAGTAMLNILQPLDAGERKARRSSNALQHRP